MIESGRGSARARALPGVHVAEVETLVLTGGHDVEKLQGAVVIDVSREGDQLTQMDGTSRAIQAGDMVMRDGRGVCCSILYGQDHRSAISLDTGRRGAPPPPSRSGGDPCASRRRRGALAGRRGQGTTAAFA